MKQNDKAYSSVPHYQSWFGFQWSNNSSQQVVTLSQSFTDVGKRAIYDILWIKEKRDKKLKREASRQMWRSMREEKSKNWLWQ